MFNNYDVLIISKRLIIRIWKLIFFCWRNDSLSQSPSVQITPQEVLLEVNPSRVAGITFEAALTENPVDIYFVMDLSNSMEIHKVSFFTHFSQMIIFHATLLHIKHSISIQTFNKTFFLFTVEHNSTYFPFYLVNCTQYYMLTVDRVTSFFGINWLVITPEPR